MQTDTTVQMKYDEDAWIAYPSDRKYFNKLWLSEKLGYLCGPGGIAPPKNGRYIVRPIYNLYGMGLGAKELELGPDDWSAVDPGYFWCEKFEGTHRSIDYSWDGHSIVQGDCFVGEKSDNQFVFKRWYRDNNFNFDLPQFVQSIFDGDCKYINIEVIGEKIIEVHLRRTPDPDYDEFIPVFEGVSINIPEHRIKKYKFIKDEEDCDGRLHPKRLGFYVRNY